MVQVTQLDHRRLGCAIAEFNNKNYFQNLNGVSNNDR